MLEDFSIRFTNVNSNALFENWDKICNHIMTTEKLVFNSDSDNIDTDINKFLFILHELLSKRFSFNTTASNFIAFNQVRHNDSDY